MATYDNSYSRLIAWLKVILPLAALAILSTLFLLSSERHGGVENLPYSQVDLDRITREQSVRAPNYSGVTSDGTAITLAATVATPDPARDGAITAERVIGALDMPSGGRVDLSAREGLIDTDGGTVDLNGAVALRSSTGWRVESEALRALLDTGRLVSPGPVDAVGPAGRLRSGAMELSLRDGRYLLRFTDGVKLVYDPPTRDGDNE